MALQLRDAVAAATAFANAVQGKTEDEAEIIRRSNICLACPLKRKRRSSPTDQVSKILGMGANREKVKPELKDVHCSVCSCSLLLLVPATKEHLHTDSPAQAAQRAAKAPQCWLPKA